MVSTWVTNPKVHVEGQMTSLIHLQNNTRQRRSIRLSRLGG